WRTCPDCRATGSSWPVRATANVCADGSTSSTGTVRAGPTASSPARRGPDMFVPLAFLTKWKDRATRAATGRLETAVPLTDDQVRATWLAASWLIGYPDDEVVDRLELLAR